MARYYDPNKDYSREIEKAKREGRDTTQLERERQAKIDDKYGGKEPTMWGSNKTYTEASRDDDRDTINRGMGETGSPWRPSKPTHYGPGSKVAREPVKNNNLMGGAGFENKRIGLGEWTYVFDERGKQIGKVKDYGASANGTVDVDPGLIHKSDNHLGAYEAAKRGDWDTVGNYLNKISEANGADMTEANDYNTRLQMAFPGVKDYLRDKYDKAYGYGGWDDPNFRPGGTPNTSYRDQIEMGGGRPQAPAGSVGYIPQGNIQSSGQITIPGGAVGQPNQDGYGSFDEFMDGMGYGDISAETQKAIQAAVQAAVDGYTAQIGDVNRDTDALAEQAYVAKMMGEKNLDQQLAANGYAGGMADSQRIASEAGYQDRLNDLELQRMEVVEELERAIQNAKLSGDMQTAQEMAGYLTQLQGQWNQYVQNQQAQARDDYWRQQELDRADQSTAYNRAMALIQAGFLPGDELLSAAGINRNVAQQMVSQLGMPAETAAPKPGPKLRGFNNQGYDKETIRNVQRQLGVTPDGMWGRDSQAAADALGKSLQELAGTPAGNDPAGSYRGMIDAISNYIAIGNTMRAQQLVDQAEATPGFPLEELDKMLTGWYGK